MATKRQRYMISVDVNMFNEIEDFRYEKRFPTRSEATTELLRLGLETHKKEHAQKEKPQVNTETHAQKAKKQKDKEQK